MAWVNREWHWDVIARRFSEILAGDAAVCAGDDQEYSDSTSAAKTFMTTFRRTFSDGVR